MTDNNSIDAITFIESGIKLLGDALQHFQGIKECNKAGYVCLLTHKLINVADTVLEDYKNSQN